MSVHLRPPTNAKNRETARYIATPRPNYVGLAGDFDDPSLKYLAPPRSSSPANDTAAVAAVQRAYARMNIRESPPKQRGSSNPQANGFFSSNTSPPGQPAATDPSIQIINGPVRKFKNGSIQQPVPLDDNNHPVLGIVKAAAPSSSTISPPGQQPVIDPSSQIINGPVRKLQNGSIPHPVPLDVNHPVLGIDNAATPAVVTREHGRLPPLNISKPPAPQESKFNCFKMITWTLLTGLGISVGVLLILIIIHYSRNH